MTRVFFAGINALLVTLAVICFLGLLWSLS